MAGVEWVGLDFEWVEFVWVAIEFDLEVFKGVELDIGWVWFEWSL